MRRNIMSILSGSACWAARPAGIWPSFSASPPMCRDSKGRESPGDPSSRVACVVNYYGPSDFTKSYGKSVDAAVVLPMWLGGDLQHAYHRHILASPLNWVTPDAAPTLLLHGTLDQYVAFEQAEWMRDRLQIGRCGSETRAAGRSEARLRRQRRRTGGARSVRVFRCAFEEMNCSAGVLACMDLASFAEPRAAEDGCTTNWATTKNGFCKRSRRHDRTRTGPARPSDQPAHHQSLESVRLSIGRCRPTICEHCSKRPDGRRRRTMNSRGATSWRPKTTRKNSIGCYHASCRRTRFGRSRPRAGNRLHSIEIHRNGHPNGCALHDLGLASADLCLEATARGICVHQMAGILPDRARELFEIPSERKH